MLPAGTEKTRTFVGSLYVIGCSKESRRDLGQGNYKVQLQTRVEKSDVRSDASPRGSMREMV